MDLHGLLTQPDFSFFLLSLQTTKPFLPFSFGQTQSCLSSSLSYSFPSVFFFFFYWSVIKVTNSFQVAKSSNLSEVILPDFSTALNRHNPSSKRLLQALGATACSCFSDHLLSLLCWFCLTSFLLGLWRRPEQCLDS